MKAILTNADKSLCWAEVPTPAIKADEVLVEIKAAAINRADLMQRAGDYPPPEGCPEWMGLEVSGVIVEIGEGARRQSAWKPGDEVCALLGGGGYAQYVAVRYDMLMPVPKGLSMVEAAAMPEAFATAYVNLFTEGKLRPGENVYISAGGSGLASVMIPMAKAFGAYVITSVRGERKAKAIANLGADIIVNTLEQDIADMLRIQAEQGHPLDIAIDCVGGEAVAKCMPHMNRGGRWILIATLAGDMALIDMKTMYKKKLTLSGNTLRARSPEEKARILADLVKRVWPMIENGKMARPTIYRVLPIQQAEEAHAILQNNENIGKVVLVTEP